MNKGKRLPMVMSDGYMSREQLAAYLGVSVAQIKSLVSSGTIPEPFKISQRIVRWKKADVDAAIKASSTTPEGEYRITIGDLF
jgi:excisionase family DNA binding protein